MISVIIPTYQEQQFLPGLLDLLRKQLPEGSQVIVSDGDSSDNTVSIARSFGCDIVMSKKRKPAVQRNAGARKAKGDILLFLDADTRFDDNFIQRMLQEFTRRRLDVASFYFRFDSPKLRFRLLFWYGTVLMYFLHLLHPVAIGAAILVRKSMYEKSGGFDENVFVGEDHLFAKSVQDIGGAYDLLNIPGIYFSLRRFYKEGFWTMVYKWHYFAYYYMRYGAFNHKIVPYEFGKYN